MKMTDYNSTAFNFSGKINISHGFKSYTKREVVFSFDNNYLVGWLVTCFLNPFISLLGIAGNMFSVVFIYRQGLKKTSNILILSLAIADTMFLLGNTNIAYFIYCFGDKEGFFFPKDVAFSLFVCYQFAKFIEKVGNCSSVITTTLITFERSVAVFFPLKFSRVVTLFRIRIAVLCVFLSSIAIGAFLRTGEKFVYDVDPISNQSVGLIVIRNIYNEQFYVYISIYNILFVLFGPIPLAFVVLGSTMIGLKVRYATKKRQKLMSPPITASNKGPSDLTRDRPRLGYPSRTTLTLLAVCVIFSLTLGYDITLHTVALYLMGEGFLSRTEEGLMALGRFLSCVNSSCNFLIYVACNRNFRSVIKDFVNGCIRCRRVTGTI